MIPSIQFVSKFLGTVKPQNANLTSGVKQAESALDEVSLKGKTVESFTSLGFKDLYKDFMTMFTYVDKALGSKVKSGPSKVLYNMSDVNLIRESYLPGRYNSASFQVKTKDGYIRIARHNDNNDGDILFVGVHHDENHVMRDNPKLTASLEKLYYLTKDGKLYANPPRAYGFAHDIVKQKVKVDSGNEYEIQTCLNILLRKTLNSVSQMDIKNLTPKKAEDIFEPSHFKPIGQGSGVVTSCSSNTFAPSLYSTRW